MTRDGQTYLQRKQRQKERNKEKRDDEKDNADVGVGRRLNEARNFKILSSPRQGLFSQGANVSDKTFFSSFPKVTSSICCDDDKG